MMWYLFPIFHSWYSYSMPHSLRPGVLIVEDEEELLSLVARLFDPGTYEIFRARNGIEALAVFHDRRDAIDLVVTDLGLPQLGGADVIAEIRASKPDVKIVGFSGYSGREVRELALKAGADMFCEKPFAAGEFLASVRSLLGRTS